MTLERSGNEESPRGNNGARGAAHMNRVGAWTGKAEGETSV